MAFYRLSSGPCLKILEHKREQYPEFRDAHGASLIRQVPNVSAQGFAQTDGHSAEQDAKERLPKLGPEDILSSSSCS